MTLLAIILILLHIGKFILFFKRLNVRYWHKADIQHQGLVNPPAILPTSEILVVLRLLRYFCYATNMEPTRR